MTTPRNRGYGELAPSVVVDQYIRTSAGQYVTARVLVTNRAPEPRIVSVTTLGVDASWLPRPSRSRPVMPGETIAADLTFSPAVGTVPAQYPIAIAVQTLDPVSEQTTAPTTIAETTLVIDAPGQIDIEVQPAEITGFRRKRLTVFLHNAGMATESVDLEVDSLEAARVQLEATQVDVPPATTVPVRGHVHIAPRIFGNRSRFTYMISARGSGAPRRAEGAVTTRAFFGASSSKFFGLVVIIAVWGALALIYIPKLSSAIQNSQNKASNKAAAIGSTAATKAPSGNGGGSGGSGGSGGAGGSGGSGGSGGAGGSGGSGGSGGAANSASALQLSGTVAGQSPGGVNVAIAPTSLVNEAAQGATGVGVNTSSFAELGKIPASALTATATSAVSSSRSTTTQTTGTWSFSDVRVPGYYLLTFAKPGYQTQRYIIDSSTAVATQPLTVNLVSAQGALGGQIRGPSGPLGAAQITITDGTNTFTTSSNSTGAVGTWSVSSVSTPSTYLVSATKDGMSTESQLVTLAAGGTANSVNLTLKAGVASLTGKVEDATAKTGLGGAQVTATNGTITRTATSVTSGPIGDYTLSSLPPGSYTVTFSAPGYLEQTEKTTVTAGASPPPLGAALHSISHKVTGSVIGVHFNPDGTTDGAPPSAIPGAGLVLSAGDNTYKVLSAGDGTFEFDGVAPATYTLSVQYAGLITAYRQVTVGSDDVALGSPSFSMVAASVSNSSSITGFVGSATSPSNALCGGAISCTKIISLTLVDDKGHEVDTTVNSDGTGLAATTVIDAVSTGPTAFTLFGELATDRTAGKPVGLKAGLYHITISATNFLPSSANVQVPFNGVGVVPQLNLFPSNTIKGTVDALGDLTNDGPTNAPVAPPFHSCVWAVPSPSNTTPAAPTSCTATGEPASTCLTTGTPGPAMGIIGSDDSYTINGLCDGTYTVFTLVTNPYYLNTVPTVDETLFHGQTVPYSPHIARKGRVHLSFQTIDATTGAITVENTTFTLTSASCTHAVTTTPVPVVDSTGKTVIPGVDASVAVTCTASEGGQTGSVNNVFVTPDNDTNATISFHGQVGNLFGQVTSAYSDSGANPVAGATVTVTGTVGFDGTTPISGTATATTDSNGCFVIVPGGLDNASTTPVTGGFGGCTSVLPANANSTNSTFTLASSAVTVSITGSNMTALAAISRTMSTTSLNTFGMTPVAVSFGTQTVTSSNPALDLSTVHFTATAEKKTDGSSRATGSGTLSVGVIAQHGTTLTWTDSNTGQSNKVWPGIYDITGTLSGYTVQSATLTCTLGASCVLSPAITVNQLASVSGTVQGLLNTPPATTPVQNLGGVTVQLERCMVADCSSLDSSVIFKTTTDTGGGYSFGSAGQGIIPMGTYDLTADAGPAYDTGDVKPLTVAFGANLTQAFVLPVTLQTLKIGLQTSGPNPPPVADLFTTASTITLTRVSDGVSIPLKTGTPGSDGLYVFENLVPTLYTLSASGDGIQPLTVQITVPFATTRTNPSTTLYAPVSLTRNSISGSVQGAVGKTGAIQALDNVPVALWTTDSSGALVIATGTDGVALTTQTAAISGVHGSFAFTNVKNGTYVLHANDAVSSPTAISVLDGYHDAVSAAPVAVNNGIAGTFAPVTLDRFTLQVVVTVKTPVGDDISASTAPTLTNNSDNTWTFTAGAATAVTGGYSWTFNQVVFGCWNFSLTLPSIHHGTMAFTSANSTDAALTCTGDFKVPGTGSAEVDAIYTLSEYQPSVTVTMTKLTADTNSAPSTVALAVGTLYTNTSFATGSSQALPLWLNDSSTPSATATLSATGWPATASGTLSQASPHATLTFDEVGGTATVKIGGTTYPNTATATLSVTTVPSGVTAPANQTPHAGDTVTYGASGIAGLPFGTYTATITGSYTDSSSVVHAITGNVPFTISAGSLAPSVTLTVVVTP